MKDWITVTEINASQKLSKIDPKSIIWVGHLAGGATGSLIRTIGGHEIKVTDTPLEIEAKMRNIK